MSQAIPTLVATSLVTALSTKLTSVFGRDFDVWTDQDGEWVCSSDSACAAQRKEICDRQSSGFDEAWVSAVGPNEYRVCVPFQTIEDRAIGFCNFVADDDWYLLALAKAAQKELRQSQTIDELTAQSIEFETPPKRQFEQLELVHQMADCLEISSERQLRDLFECFVPWLPTSIKCQWAAFVGTSDLRSRLDCACEHRNTVISSGHGSVGEESLIGLISQFGGQAMSQPFVSDELAEQDYAGVRQVIVTRVFKRERHWGWLVAGNGHRDGCSADGELTCSALALGTEEAAILNSAARILSTHAHNVEVIQQKEDLVVNIVRTLVTTIEAKDQYARGHSERVAMFGRLLAKQMELDDASLDRIYLSGLLHDIGKVGVPDATLCKPGKLTADEFEQIKKYPEIGWQMLQGLKPLQGVLDGVLHHHESVDGGGYPDGLVGTEIPLDGRILAVADAYDAMTSHRAYRSGLTQEQAEQILREGAGVQWDAQIIEALFEIMPEVIKIRQSYRKPSIKVARRLRLQQASANDLT